MTARLPRGAPGLPPGLERVRVRTLLVEAPVVRFALHPGDRALVAPGEVVGVGGPLLERARAAAIVSVDAADVPRDARPGDWWVAPGRRRGLRRGRAGIVAGELLHREGGRWRVVAGDRTDVVETPVAGIVRSIRPAIGIVLATAGVGIPGVASVGGPSRGRLEVAAVAGGELRAGSIDIRRAGAILVAGSRVDAETLTRGRAMGVRGIVAGAVASRELRDLAAAEHRQRASLQPIPAFGALALEGHLRAAIATPVMAILGAAAGREIALVGDPPLLVLDAATAELPRPAPDAVRVRSGPSAGLEGRWGGLAGRRRFAAGVVLEAGVVELPEGGSIVAPLADLERFA